MHKVLELFGFGENIRQWISAFYSNIKSSVIVNGKASSSFQVGRGCRQGDPVSPYLFILCAELLACKIRENDNIKGITISDTECKISQFADDTSLFLDGGQDSFVELFKDLADFESISGLKLNYEKTCNIWLGSKRNSNTQYVPNVQMKWNPAQFKLLGLWFTNDLSNMVEMNFMDKFNQTKQLFNTWMKRSITPAGKVAVLKSLVLSKLVYLWIMLPNPPDHLISQLQNMCFNFVWDKKRDKVKRSNAVHPIEKGGLNIPDIATYIKSLKLTWLKKCLSESCNPKWKQLLVKECPEINMLEEYGPVVLKNAVLHHTIYLFWKNVFDSYLELYDSVPVKEGAEILMEPLFFNNKFQIDGKVVYFDDWIEKEVFFVKDLVNETGKFLSLRDFQTKFDIQVPFLEFCGLVSAVKQKLRKLDIQLKDNSGCKTHTTFGIVTRSPKGAKVFYDIMLGEHTLPNACKSWERIIGTEVEWLKIFKTTKKIQETKLRWFQMKINYRVLVTNSILKSMGVTASNECNFCKRERDTIFHYLWECECVQTFWNAFGNYLREICFEPHSCTV